MVDWWQTGSIIDGFGYLLVRAVFERAYLPRVMEVPGFPLVTVLQPPPRAGQRFEDSSRTEGLAWLPRR
jgi:hypothetical protein